jgi:ABC-2 type transport system ATP-binding protein
MFAARNLHLTRGDFSLAVDRLDLPEGQCVGLIGANGAGKTTLLEVLGGRLRCPGGMVELDGVGMGEFGVHRSLAVGLMPDQLQGVRSMAVEEHFSFRARFFPQWDPDYLGQLVTELGIPLHKPLAALSRGTQAKVAFAAVEAYRPPVLLLDEPTSGLDPVVRRELRECLARALRRSPRRSALFSTHLVEDLRDIADRIVIIRDGGIVADIPVPEDATAEARAGLLDRAIDLLSPAKAG